MRLRIAWTSMYGDHLIVSGEKYVKRMDEMLASNHGGVYLTRPTEGDFLAFLVCEDFKVQYLVRDCGGRDKVVTVRKTPAKCVSCRRKCGANKCKFPDPFSLGG